MLPTLFKVVNNGEQHCYTAHAIQPQQYCSMLLTTVNNVGSTTLFNPVELQAHDLLPCTQQKMNNLFQVDENSIEQYFAAHIVPGC